MLSKLKLLSACVAMCGLSACATITTGASQSLSVDTVPERGAQCTLTNDKGTWSLPETPGSVTVTRAYSALNVKCKKEGGGEGATTVQSSTKGVAYGNILLGGIIGGAVDMSSGAAYDYPASIIVTMSGTAKPVSLELPEEEKKVEKHKKKKK